MAEVGTGREDPGSCGTANRASRAAEEIRKSERAEGGGEEGESTGKSTARKEGVCVGAVSRRENFRTWLRASLHHCRAKETRIFWEIYMCQAL